jgi:hypothetical protein
MGAIVYFEKGMSVIWKYRITFIKAMHIASLKTAWVECTVYYI